MHKAIRQVWDFFFFTHIYLALGAISQVLLTCYTFKIPISLPLILVIFLSTFCAYNYSMVNFRWKKMKSDGSPRQNLFSNYYFPIKVSIVASGFIILILNLLIHPRILPVLIFEAMVCFLYSMSFLSRKGNKISLRKIPVVKNVIISFLWATSVVIIPFLNVLDWSGLSLPTLILFYGRAFILILIISLGFDIRDIETDLSKNTKTLSILLGSKNSKVLAIFLSLLMVVYQSFMKVTVGFNELLGLNISALLLIVCILGINSKRSDYFYMFLLDGLIFIQFPIVLLLRNI